MYWHFHINLLHCRKTVSFFIKHALFTHRNTFTVILQHGAVIAAPQHGGSSCAKYRNTVQQFRFNLLINGIKGIVQYQQTNRCKHDTQQHKLIPHTTGQVTRIHVQPFRIKAHLCCKIMQRQPQHSTIDHITAFTKTIHRPEYDILCRCQILKHALFPKARSQTANLTCMPLPPIS